MFSETFSGSNDLYENLSKTNPLSLSPEICETLIASLVISTPATSSPATLAWDTLDLKSFLLKTWKIFLRGLGVQYSSLFLILQVYIV